MDKNLIKDSNLSWVPNTGEEPASHVGGTPMSCPTVDHPPPEEAPGNGEGPDQRSNGLERSITAEYDTQSLGEITRSQRLERELIEFADSERMRLGLDLHDGLGSHLVGILYLCKNLEARLGAGEQVGTRAIQEIRKLMDEAIALTHNMAKGLCLPGFRPDNLASALHEHADSVGKTFDVDCQFECSERSPDLDLNTALHLYRIAQEAINNAVKHSQASKIKIKLMIYHKGLTLSIIDNGVGLPMDLDQSTGLGVRLMTYRAQMISAKLNMNSLRQGGSEVRCTVGRPSSEYHSLVEG